MSLKTYNLKALAAEAGISMHVLRQERKQLFKERPDLKESFGNYKHKILSSEQVEILVNNIPYLKPLKKNITY